MRALSLQRLWPAFRDLSPNADRSKCHPRCQSPYLDSQPSSTVPTHHEIGTLGFEAHSGYPGFHHGQSPFTADKQRFSATREPFGGESFKSD
jgi:hypothetical protein